MISKPYERLARGLYFSATLELLLPTMIPYVFIFKTKLISSKEFAMMLYNVYREYFQNILAVIV